MSSQGDINNLIDQSIPTTNPLNQGLKMMVADMYRAYNSLFPASVVSRTTGAGGALVTQNNVANFVANLQPTNLHLTWDDSPGHIAYEIRYQPSASTNWDTAIFLINTDSRQADISPFTIPLLYGTYTFLIKAINSAGVYSSVASSATIIISIITAVTLSSSVVGNNVLLHWTTPTSSLAIKEYIIKKNGSEIGRITGTFDIVFESTGGTYTYTVTPVDIVGNVGTVSPNLTLTLSDPTDFQFQAKLTSSLTGTKVNTVIDSDGTLFAIIDPSISYENHFILGG